MSEVLEAINDLSPPRRFCHCRPRNCRHDEPYFKRRLDRLRRHGSFDGCRHPRRRKKRQAS